MARETMQEQPRNASLPAGAAARVRQGLERLSATRANARAGLVADSAAAAALLLAGWLAGADALTAFGAIAAGLLLSSFVEYAFHRWLFHGRAGAAAAGHRAHHADPAGDRALPFFLPPLAMLLLGAALNFVAPHAPGLLFAGALAAGYAAYGIAHTAIHQSRFQRPALVRWAARHHIHHRHPQRNFGVTTSLWDVILGTRYVRARAPAVRR